MKLLYLACCIILLGLSSGCRDYVNSEADVLLIAPDIPDEQAIIEAAYGGDIETVKRILGQSPDFIHAQDHNGNTLLHMASGSNRLEIVTYLLEQGADKYILNYNEMDCYEYAEEEDANEEILNLLR